MTYNDQLQLLISLLKVPDEISLREKLLSKYPEFKQDEHGNVYLINPGKPLLCAHLDNVGGKDAHKKLSKVHKAWGKIKGAGNIGADDKCGVAMALSIYKELGNEVSLLFPSREEVGGIGSRKLDKNLLTGIPYCVCIDRRGGTDVIASGNDYCTIEFEEEVMMLLKDYGFSVNHGTFCDADQLNTTLNCINISCGYHNAHCSNEYVEISQYMNTLNAVKHLVSAYQERLEPIKDKYDYNLYHQNGYIFGPDEDDDDDLFGDYKEQLDPIEYYDDEYLVLNRTIQLVSYETGQRFILPKGDYEIYMPTKTYRM